MNLETLPVSGNSVTPGNNNMALLDWSTVFGRNPTGTSGLNWAFHGTPTGGEVTGKWGGLSVTAGTLVLTDNTANYIVADRATGAVSVSTALTNWNNTSAYARVYKVNTSGGLVTGYDDYRMGEFGTISGPGSSAATTAGRQSIYVNASRMSPSNTGGCSAYATTATTANQPDIQACSFDQTTQQFAQFSIAMPKKWDEGTITAKFVWSHPSTTVNFGVVWQLQGVAISDNEIIPQAYGTAQTSTDTGGVTNQQYISPETAAITLAGSPAAEDVVHFRVARNPADGADTMAVGARLIGVILFITTAADTDA